MNINTLSWNRIRYNAYAAIYDLPGRFFTPYRAKSLQQINIQPGEKVLLVGAATGLDLELLPPDCHISAIDYAPTMIQRLNKRAASMKLIVDAQVMNAEQMNFGNETFDVIVAHLILAVIPNPTACWQEMVRVLKSGGRITVFDKFLPPGRTASFPRHCLNGLTTFLFTDINRQIETITSTCPITQLSDESVLFGQNFRILTFQKH